MVRLDISDVLCEEDEIRLTIRSSPLEYPMALRVARNETVGDVKRFMGERLEKYMDEMTMMISMAYPYPLPDDMRLDWLLVEHRDLILRVHEGGYRDSGSGNSIVGEDGIEKETVWWAQTVPMRYLQWVEDKD